jgi:hypothetical protein
MRRDSDLWVGAVFLVPLAIGAVVFAFRDPAPLPPPPPIEVKPPGKEGSQFTACAQLVIALDAGLAPSHGVDQKAAEWYLIQLQEGAGRRVAEQVTRPATVENLTAAELLCLAEYPALDR